MGRTLNDVVEKLPQSRQERIAARYHVLKDGVETLPLGPWVRRHRQQMLAEGKRAAKHLIDILIAGMRARH